MHALTVGKERASEYIAMINVCARMCVCVCVCVCIYPVLEQGENACKKCAGAEMWKNATDSLCYKSLWHRGKRRGFQGSGVAAKRSVATNLSRCSREASLGKGQLLARRYIKHSRRFSNLPKHT